MVSSAPTYHIPVLAEAVRDWAAGGRRAVDATLGGGGHAALLLAGGASVLGIDRDPAAIAAAQAHLGDSIRYLTAAYGSPEALDAVRAFQPDRILLDLGISSHQVDTAERGFTFRPGAPLDMRMTPGAGPSARDVLNSWPEERLAAAFEDFGDERRARALAREIVRRRLNPLKGHFAQSDDFVNAIRATLGPRSGPGDFARLFQALRIAVNDELGQLTAALPEFRDALASGGRLGVITYHSGEDRIVKHLFREWGKSCVCPPRQPICTCRGRALGRVLTKKAIVAGAAEVAGNVRARSAQFRAFETAEEGRGES
ncbi:MAG TPA: 16S rRNA (cytosine(1402)-N(4))-methyltransferase RsmH [Gemmatimonadales bacterium]|jgi:16S rRNA (cytosine1402-N4)-methyltransferase|nr:16S rRNA (cytosine(1402)-N(4))-methyltransferase RsmH [Gemmatimonadales bacterium]